MSMPKRTESSSNQFPSSTDEETESREGKELAQGLIAGWFQDRNKIPWIHESHIGSALLILNGYRPGSSAPPISYYLPGSTNHIITTYFIRNCAIDLKALGKLHTSIYTHICAHTSKL